MLKETLRDTVIGLTAGSQENITKYLNGEGKNRTFIDFALTTGHGETNKTGSGELNGGKHLMMGYMRDGTEKTGQ